MGKQPFRRLGFAGPKNRPYSKRGLRRVFSAGRQRISRVLWPESRKLRAAKKSLREFGISLIQTSKRDPTTAVAQLFSLQYALASAQIEHNRKVLFLFTRFQGLFNITSRALHKMQLHEMELEGSRLSQGINNFKRFYADKNFKNDWLLLKKNIIKRKMKKAYKAQMETVYNAIVTSVEKVDIASTTSVVVSGMLNKSGGRITKAAGLNFVYSTQQLIQSQLNIARSSNRLLTVLIQSAILAGCSGEFSFELRRYKKECEQITSKLLDQVEFWEEQLRAFAPKIN